MHNAQPAMNKNHTTPLGVIEGFFGKHWNWDARSAYARFLALHKFNFYIYAPKSDKHLRKHWQYDWPTDEKNRLQQLRESYRIENIDFGIGLSPHEIYLDASRDQRDLLTKRIQQINTLAPDILCILFDDMRGDIPGLAQIQIDIAHQAAHVSTAKKIIFCPTYYSFDPVLEKVFGTMPENYWQTFAKNLDRNIDMFWTGEKVCSVNYPQSHLDQVTALLGRKPFLWDNYPVNDGAVKSNLLQLRAVDQSHALLDGEIAGHALNPMNQAWLSQIPLASLPIAYQQKNNYDPNDILEKICIALCGEKLATELFIDIALFQDSGLKNLTDAEKKSLQEKYSDFSGSHYAREIIDWLKGEYQFDPACLTE
ncbi:MAG: hyaluronidase [Cellvibrio sp. 79]|nr:MAG: hyaluronidase [Cellvibrio sp. 79]